MIKILPFWGLSLIGTFIAYLGPLVYMNNREIIDAQIEHAQSIVNSQAHQLRDIAEERTAHATGLMRQYVDDYSAKVQQYMPSPNRRSMSPEMAKVPAALKTESPEPEIKTSDFPEAPRDEPVGEQAQSMEPSQQEPLLA